MAKISDVAARAGVSVATVSRVSNGHPVNEAMERRVRRAMSELNYTPSRAARTLRRQTSEIIALVIPDIENPYFTELARGVEDVASEAGYSIVLCNSDSKTEKETTYLRIAVAESMAGVIIAPASEQTRLDDPLAAGRPVVAVDRTSHYAIDHVVMANREAGHAATLDLVDAGYRRIACIVGPPRVDTAIERVAGWQSALASAFPDLDATQLLRFSNYQMDGGRDAMESLLGLADPPDAVVAGNNLVGVGALQVLAEHGLTPSKVGVAVIGSLPFTTLPPTAVTVVRLPARTMGSLATTMLLERIGGDRQPPRTVVLPNEIQPATARRGPSRR